MIIVRHIPYYVCSFQVSIYLQGTQSKQSYVIMKNMEVRVSHLVNIGIKSSPGAKPLYFLHLQQPASAYQNS